MFDPAYMNSFTIRLHETGQKGTLTVPNIFNYFQDIASEHSASKGQHLTALHRRNLTWVISRHHVKIMEYPSWNETIQVRTWPSHRKGPFAMREFTISDSEGRTSILATTSFVLLDTRSKKPVAVEEHLPEYTTNPKRAIADDFPTLPLLEHCDSAQTFQVRKHDLDMNRHVNNAVYVQWALESVPDEIFNTCQLLEIEVSYRKEAFYREMVISKTQVSSNQENPVLVHRIERKNDGAELTRLRTVWGKPASHNTR